MVDIPAKKYLIDGPIDRDNPRKVDVRTLLACPFCLPVSDNVTCLWECSLCHFISLRTCARALKATTERNSSLSRSVKAKRTS